MVHETGLFSSHFKGQQRSLKLPQQSRSTLASDRRGTHLDSINPFSFAFFLFCSFLTFKKYKEKGSCKLKMMKVTLSHCTDNLTQELDI